MSQKALLSDQKLASYYNGSRVEMLEFVPPGVHRILEVGCGNGVFSSFLKEKRKAEVWGLDICKSAIEESKKRLDRAILGDIENEEIDLPLNYFDCIIFNDVLEHMRYPWVVLKRMQKHLVEFGYIVASIPNIRYYYHIYDLLRYQEWEYSDAGVLDKTHLRFFTKKSINAMFEACDYRVIEITGINPSKFSWKFNLINKLMSNRFEDMRYLQFACLVQMAKLNE